MFPTQDSLIHAARITKSYGTQGGVMLTIAEDLSDYFEEDEPVFLLFNSLPVPFFIQSVQFKGRNKAVVTFEDIESAAEAEEIVGKAVYLDSISHPELADSASDHEADYILGFTVHNDSGQPLGVITQIHDFSGNLCLELDNSDALIPFHEDLLLDFDPEARAITLHIEEGLLP